MLAAGLPTAQHQAKSQGAGRRQCWELRRPGGPGPLSLKQLEPLTPSEEPLAASQGREGSRRVNEPGDAVVGAGAGAGGPPGSSVVSVEDTGLAHTRLGQLPPRGGGAVGREPRDLRASEEPFTLGLRT